MFAAMTELCRNCDAHASIEKHQPEDGGPTHYVKTCHSCGLHGRIDLGL
jgi:hypothetical protein